MLFRKLSDDVSTEEVRRVSLAVTYLK